MAARIRTIKVDDRWRAKIQASQLVNRLNEHIKAPIDQPVLSKSQIDAIRLLLNKVAPDLKAVEVTGQEGGPIQFSVKIIDVDG